MPTGIGFRDKIKSILGQLQATPRIVSLRDVTVTGGNTRLGLGGTRTVTDTVVDPQPAAQKLGASEVANIGGLAEPGDWWFIFDGTIAEATLRNRQIVFGDEVLHIVQIDPYAFKGVVVGWSVIARTITARTS